jgi:hypothetical protein
MDLFRELGDEIESLWLDQNYNEDDLPAIAADALRRHDLPSRLSAWDVVEWSLAQTELPPQRDVPGRFGDPPITIYSGPRFHVDLYFWFDGTTAIHQHGFCGAFQVLLGSSIHSWYEFERREKINTFCEIGDIRLKVCEILEVGDVQEIWGGRRYIHSLFHLDRPSATIVVRTDRSPLDLPQFSYEKPNLAIDPFFEQNTSIKKLQVMAALIRAGRPEADELITRLLDASDLQTSYVILSRLRPLMKSDQLKQFFRPEDTRSRFSRYLDVVIKRHGPNAEVLVPVFEHIEMLDEIVTRRSYVTEAEHRFFMALLLNADRRDVIFDLIKHRFPDVDPVEKVLDWVFDLAQTRIVGIDLSNAIGIPDFGDTEMSVLEALLRGKTDFEITSGLSDTTPSSGRNIDEAISAIRSSVIFRPLLR